MCKGLVIHSLTWSNDWFYICMQFDCLKSTRYQTSPQQPPTTTLPHNPHKDHKEKKKKTKKINPILISPTYAN